MFKAERDDLAVMLAQMLPLLSTPENSTQKHMTSRLQFLLIIIIITSILHISISLLVNAQTVAQWEPAHVAKQILESNIQRNILSGVSGTDFCLV